MPCSGDITEICHDSPPGGWVSRNGIQDRFFLQVPPFVSCGTSSQSWIIFLQEFSTWIPPFSCSSGNSSVWPVERILHQVTTRPRDHSIARSQNQSLNKINQKPRTISNDLYTYKIYLQMSYCFFKRYQQVVSCWVPCETKGCPPQRSGAGLWNWGDW